MAGIEKALAQSVRDTDLDLIVGALLGRAPRRTAPIQAIRTERKTGDRHRDANRNRRTQPHPAQ